MSAKTMFDSPYLQEIVQLNVHRFHKGLNVFQSSWAPCHKEEVRWVSHSVCMDHPDSIQMLLCLHEESS